MVDCFGCFSNVGEVSEVPGVVSDVLEKKSLVTNFRVSVARKGVLKVLGIMLALEAHQSLLKRF